MHNSVLKSWFVSTKLFLRQSCYISPKKKKKNASFQFKVFGEAHHLLGHPLQICPPEPRPGWVVQGSEGVVAVKGEHLKNMFECLIRRKIGRVGLVGAIVSNANNGNNSLSNEHAQFDMHHGERGRKWKRDFQTFQGDKMLMFSTQE